MWSLIQDSISWLLDHSEEEENFDEQLLFEKEEEEIYSTLTRKNKRNKDKLKK